MVAKALSAAVFSLAIFGFALSAFAQEQSANPPLGKMIFDRLDNLGKKIFGAPEEENRDRPTAEPRTPPRKTNPIWANGDASSARAGSVLKRPNSSAAKPSNVPLPSQRPAKPGVYDSTDSPGDVRAAAPVRRLKAGAASPDDTESASPSPPPRVLTRQQSPAADANINAAVETVDPGSPAAMPLHERLNMARRSTFGNLSASEARTPPPAPSGDSAPRPLRPAGSSVPTPANPATRPLVAQRPVVVTSDVPAVTDAYPPVEKPAPADDGLLIARKSPILAVETVGPRKISVGKESAYEVAITNSGEVAAEDLLVLVNLPEWAEVAGAEASKGSAQLSTPGPQAGPIQWKVGALGAQAREKLVLRIVPRQSRPFDLAVRWEYKPPASQAMIEVQEPKLAVRLDGPREVFYGKPVVYKLKLSNTGTGAAENVVITLLPIGAGENVPAAHKLGVLAAGDDRTINIELTPRQAGNLTIQVEARGDGAARAEVSERVVVLRPDLQLAIDAPQVQFVGTTAAYTIRVRNPGTAATKNILVTVSLPAGAKYLSSAAGSRLDASGTKLSWTLPNLDPGIEQAYALKCGLAHAGANRLEAAATADDDVTAAITATTRVDAVANLVLDVKDPGGPMAVGEETAYEIHVRNRGTKAAENVEVLVYFSRGVEPLTADGGPNRISAGQVAFAPIPNVAPGEELTLKIHARADAPGNHTCRTEVHCKPLGARLVSEATNLYYHDGPATQPARDAEPLERTRVQTVDRRQAPPPAPKTE